MAKEFSFGGFTASGPLCKFTDLFDEEYNDDGHLIAVSKETFHQDDDPLSFDYKYVVEVEDLRAVMGENEVPEENMVAYLRLIPTPESLCKEIQNDILSSMGSDDINRIYYMDMICQGGCDVIMASDSWHTEDDLYDVTDDSKCVEKLDIIATILDAINSFRGFYIDRCWNRIGSTGWDTLEHAVHGEDWFKPAMDRYEAAMAERGNK